MPGIELLAPAKDAQTAITAILCGADAIYIGPQRFGAREAAGNDIDEIRKVTDFAHLYYARVYATVNTLLFDAELQPAVDLMHELADAGVDAFIIQDMGLLEMDLPDRPIIASTQVNNATPEKVKFLEDVGFSRVILARELSLDQIIEIRQQTSIELECFVHGALCVSMSGQCYLSCAQGGRSGNRGQCAQPCRKRYSLENPRTGEVLAKNQYLLSLKDMNRSTNLEALLDAGITSFKIEGRLKSIPYVANVTGHYRQLLDTILHPRGLDRRSSGKVNLGFDPDPARTFNRGFTDYGITGKQSRMGSIQTPKSLGQYLGTVTKVKANGFKLDSQIELHNGDGICFFDTDNELKGTVINHADGEWIKPKDTENIRPGMSVYRNHDHQFEKLLSRVPAERKIAINLKLSDTPDGIRLDATDENGNNATVHHETAKEPAQKPEAANETIQRQLTRLGNTIFECTEFRQDLADTYFFPVAFLNQLRREVVEALIKARRNNCPSEHSQANREDQSPYPEKHLTFTGNVLNDKARQFYERHGVESFEPAAESGTDLTGQKVMTTKYCILQQLNMCSGKNNEAEPLHLIDEENNRLQIQFTCGNCGMEIYKL